VDQFNEAWRCPIVRYAAAMKYINAATISLSLLLDLSFGVALAQAPSVDAKIQDSIVAGLAVNDQRAVLEWRFIKPIESTIDVRVSLGGRDLGEPPVQAYPASDDTTSVVALLDIGDHIGDPRRVYQIERGKLAMRHLSEHTRPYHRLELAVYGLESNLLAGRRDDPQSLARLLTQVAPLDEPSNLSGAIVHSIRTLEALPTSRRAIYVLTDGHNDGSIALSAARDLAISTGVILNFLLFPGDRPVDMDLLQETATATGGVLVKPEELIAFLGAPFAALDSGGTQVYSLAGAVRFFWQSNLDVRVTISYGVKAVELAVAAQLPEAGPRRTVKYLVQAHPAALAGSSLVALVLLGGLALVGHRRRMVPPPTMSDEIADQPPAIADPALTRVLAVLQNIDDGTAHVINSPVANIGRAKTNEIILEDASVSRRHAVLLQEGFGIFTIENLSTNGTFVNHQIIDKSPLKDGDLIAMGSITLRYAQSRRNEKSLGK
jgi:hypothetical protein